MTTGPPRVPGRGFVRGGGAARRRPRRAARRHGRRSPRRAARPSSAGSCWARPSPPVRCSPSTTSAPDVPCRATTRSTTRARPTGRWPACTACSPAGPGATPRPASAPTSPPGATSTRTSGHPSPTTGPPTGWRRPSPSTTAGTVSRSPTSSWPTPGARPGLFGSQVRWVSQRFGPWGVVVRGPHVPRGGGYGVRGRGPHRPLASGGGRSPPRRPARPLGRAGDLHRRARGPGAIRRRRGP